MIPNYAYWGLPNYTKFINNQTPIVPPQPNIAQAYSNSPKFSAMPTYFENTSSQNIPLKNTGSNRSESGNYEPVFNLLGINLYFDDILILCLLFFLYTEQANDFSLYLALIFLLMC